MKLLTIIQILTECDYGPTVLGLLCLSCEPGGAPLSDSAVFLHTSMSNLCQAADRLVAAGLATRVKVGRKTNVIATVQGRALVKGYQTKLDLTSISSASSSSS